MKRLKRWLSETGTTQSALAERVGVTQPTIWEWLNGESFPSAANLKRLSEVTGVSIDELLASDDSSGSRLTTSRKFG